MSANYFAPEFRVEVNGRRLEADVSKHVLSLSVSTALNVPAECGITLANPAPELPWTHTGRAELFQEGNEVKVWMGYVDQLRPVFDGVVTGAAPTFPASGAATMQVAAHDRLHRLQGTRTHRTAQEGKYDTLVAELARQAGLTAVVDDTGPALPYLVQGNRTDFEFLAALARFLRFEVVVEGRTLRFRRPADQQAPLYTLVWMPRGVGFVPGAPVFPLRSFTPRLDVRQQVAAVEVTGLDPLSREPFVGRAGAGAETARMGTETAADLAARAYGAAHTLTVSDEPVATQAEAEQRARALFNERAMELVRGRGTTLGLAGLVPGTAVRLEGLGPRFSGAYYVTGATHTLDDSGFTTAFDVRRNAIG